MMEPPAPPQVETPEETAHFPSAEQPEPYRLLCPFCQRDLTGFCLAIKAPTGQVVLVAEPVKCRFCGRYLLYGRKRSPIVQP